MRKRFYSVACENDDIEDFPNKRAALAYAQDMKRQGRYDVVVNVQDANGDLIDCIVIVPHIRHDATAAGPPRNKNNGPFAPF